MLRIPKAFKTEGCLSTFLREFYLEDGVIVALTTPLSYVYSDSLYKPVFGIIPAIRYVREVMGWSLMESKDYVEKVLAKNAGHIDATRDKIVEAWRTEAERYGRLQEFQEPVPSPKPVKSKQRQKARVHRQREL